MSVLRPRKHAKHAKPSVAAPALAAGGITAVTVVSSSGTASAATADDFRRLRVCESGGNYAINTGNGYYGAYQFDRRTWQGLGYSGTANQHPAAVQDEGARRLQAARGWQPWPACSKKLGLGRSTTTVSAQSTEERVVVARASRGGQRNEGSRRVFKAKVVKVALAPTPAPFFNGNDLTLDDADRFRIGVKMWQDRMSKRGWDLEVDGFFGPQSAAVAKRFAYQKDIAVAAPGTVDKAVWDAAWTLPVS
ncbi:MAG: transglycosylase family protein [Mycobacteriales bacterium]|nr:transglycosylase family protein [Mycobacteriales bacterium]